MTLTLVDGFFLIALLAFAVASARNSRLMGTALASLIAFIMLTDAINSQLVWVPLVGTPSGAAILFSFVFVGAKFILSPAFRTYCRTHWHAPACFALLTLAWFLGPDRNMTLSFLLRFYGSVLGLFALACFEFQQPEARAPFLRILTLFVGLAVAFSFWQELSGGLGFMSDLRDPGMVSEAVLGETLRVPSFWGSAYSMAEFVLLFTPLLFPYLRKGRAGLPAWLALGALAYALLLTQVRSGLLILMLQALLFVYLTSGTKSLKALASRLAIPALVVAGVFALIVAYGDQDGVFGRLISTVQADSVTDVKDSSSTLSRMIRVAIAWDIFTEAPLAGQGIGKMPYIYPEHGWFFENFLGGAHNMYVQVLAESGLLGFTGIGLWFAGMFKASRARLKALKATAPRVGALASIGLLTLILDGFFSEIFCYPSRFPAVLILAFLLAGGTIQDAWPSAEPYRGEA